MEAIGEPGSWQIPSNSAMVFKHVVGKVKTEPRRPVTRGSSAAAKDDIVLSLRKKHRKISKLEKAESKIEEPSIPLEAQLKQLEIANVSGNGSSINELILDSEHEEQPKIEGDDRFFILESGLQVEITTEAERNELDSEPASPVTEAEEGSGTQGRILAK